ncbi:alpha/beta hydrolase [Agrobacterium sp.]|uniref:alpha/beta fold hydrolase n=1 Tax=Agrobacterium sp. TaxID=361 RepID=UPI0028B16DEE|nr:alpha/beta hydrolase [Agrobacterium sp.]
MTSLDIEPQVTERLTVKLSDGAEIIVRRWGPERPRRIILSHGNGLAVDGLWDFGQLLMQDFEVFVFDLRNHGQNTPAEQPDMPWPRYIADIPEVFDAIVAAFGEKETHGAFHSMSSACTLVAQALTPRSWASLTLFEPPLVPSISADLIDRFTTMQEGLAARTAKRRFQFDHPEELSRSFERAKSFAQIAPKAIDRLAKATLRPAENGWQLTCSPAWEASNFVSAVEMSKYWPDLARIDTPVQLVLGDLAVHDMPILVEFGKVMEEALGFKTVICPDTNHFMQLQNPEFCARHVAAFSKKDGATTTVVSAANDRRGTKHEPTNGSAIRE